MRISHRQLVWAIAIVMLATLPLTTTAIVAMVVPQVERHWTVEHLNDLGQPIQTLSADEVRAGELTVTGISDGASLLSGPWTVERLDLLGNVTETLELEWRPIVKSGNLHIMNSDGSQIIISAPFRVTGYNHFIIGGKFVARSKPLQWPLPTPTPTPPTPGG